MRKVAIGQYIVAFILILLSFGSICYGADGRKDTNDLVESSPQEKKITGEVFMYQYSWPFSDLVKCEEYQIYLLKEVAPAAKGELKLDS